MVPRQVPRLGIGVFAGAFAVVLVTVSPALAQRTGGAGSTGGGTGVGAGSSTGTAGAASTRTGTTSNSTTNSTNPNMPQPVFLSGRVAIDDGSPLPGPVTIERVCNGATHAEGYTDNNGNFGIQLGNEQGVFQDATDGFGSRSALGMPGSTGGQTVSGAGATTAGPSQADKLLMNCELRGRLPGFRSQSIILAGRRPMDEPDIGTILLHRDVAGEGNTISVTTLEAPKDARRAFEKGLDLAKKNKWPEARVQYEKAVQIDQKFAAAWCELGKMQAGAEDFDMARGSFKMAIQSDPKFPAPYLELSIIALGQKKWQEVADLTETATRLDSFDYPQAFLFNAAAHYNMRENDTAEKSIKQAEQLDTRHEYPQILHLYGLILAQKQDYPAAATYLRDYLRLYPGATDAGAVKTELQKLDQAIARAAPKQQP